MLYGEYDKEILAKVKQVELGMLKDFIQICEKNNIDYFLLAGSALGAVRHKGMIPWDDDIDIGLCRDEYEKILDLIKKEYNNKYRIVNSEEKKSWFLMTSHIERKNTVFICDAWKDIDFSTGIFLDIYCIDKLASEQRKRNQQLWKAWFWGKLMILRATPNPVIALTGYKVKIIKIVCKLIHYVLKGFNISNQWLYNKAKKVITQYNETDSEWYGWAFETIPKKSIFRKDELFPTKICEFEGLQLRIPNKVENYLIRYFGNDYMTLPPEEKRHNHKPYKLVFEDGEEG